MNYIVIEFIYNSNLFLKFNNGRMIIRISGRSNKYFFPMGNAFVPTHKTGMVVAHLQNNWNFNFVSL